MELLLLSSHVILNTIIVIRNQALQFWLPNLCQSMAGLIWVRSMSTYQYMVCWYVVIYRCANKGCGGVGEEVEE